MTEEYINWLFSATAQSISAFIAFLLTGYALVYTMMQSIQEKDDSLEEIHLSLKKTFHRRLTYLSIITGLAIIMSLLMVYLNPVYFKEKRFLVIVTSLLSAGSIIGGISFVISIVNPAKYEKAAKTILKESKTELSLTKRMTSSYIFFDEFRRIESLIREYLREHDLYVPSKGAPRMSFSFRQMVDALHQHEIINRKIYDELMKINKYRNLVFHGHIDNADEYMVERTKKIIRELRKFLTKKSQ